MSAYIAVGLVGLGCIVFMLGYWVGMVDSQRRLDAARHIAAQITIEKWETEWRLRQAAAIARGLWPEAPS